MADTNVNYDNSSASASASGSLEQLSGQIMVAVVVVLFMVIIFVLFLHLYARWFWSQRGGAGLHTHPTPTNRRRLVFAPPTHEDPILVLHRGLEPSLLRSLPVLIFHPDDFQDNLECAVCLCQFQHGEKARLLPKCKHGFHVECIDMWFQSHITCPLCRNIVSLLDNSSKQDSTFPAPHYSLPPLEDGNSGDQYLNSIESSNFPTNVLFRGNQALLVSTGSITPPQTAAAATEEDCPSSSTTSTTTSLPRNLQDGALVIEIPRLTTDGFSSLSPSPASGFPQEEMKSPMTTRLKSLRRLLSREKRVIIPSSPGFVDVEQGGGGNSHSSKTSSDS